MCDPFSIFVAISAVKNIKDAKDAKKERKRVARKQKKEAEDTRTREDLALRDERARQFESRSAFRQTPTARRTGGSSVESRSFFAS